MSYTSSKFLPINFTRNSHLRVAIQSDDWGSIRVPSNESRISLAKNRTIDTRSPYALFDTLVNADDLNSTFNLLSEFRDVYGRSPIITANTIMANPDFRRIRESGYEKYFYTPLQDVFNQYNNSRALELWSIGHSEGYFIPQFHGREHVNVLAWLSQLRRGHKGVLEAFDHGIFGLNFSDLNLKKPNFQAAWDLENDEDEDFVIDSIRDGYRMFTNYFGYDSLTAIAPSYTWTDNMEKELKRLGVRAMQSLLIQKIPVTTSRYYKKKYHLIQSKNYQIRKIFFEPSIYGESFSLDEVLRRISIEQKMGRPAIISSHRLNYAGGLCVKNRDRTLFLLRELISSILKYWPNVEFVSSPDLIV